MPSGTKTAEGSNRVLVTGGAGLVGSRLVRALLERGRRVRVLDTRTGALEDQRENPKLEFVGRGSDELRGGIADRGLAETAVRNVGVVYHLAINWDGASWKHTLPLADLFDVNVRGTLGLLQAAKAHRVKHFIFASSAAVYGETQRTTNLKGRPKAKRVDEESACWPELWDGDPGPAYGIVKLTTEKLCLMYHRQFGLPVTVFRLEYVFTGEKELADGANIHVDDVVSAFLLAERNRKAYGQIFNLASPAPHLSAAKLKRTLGWEPRATRLYRKRSGIRPRPGDPSP